MAVTILCGDVRAILPQIADASVHCVVTSPPYWGLRDYGVDGQLGLEATPQEYVERMVEVFRDVRRVLRDDGTLWINLGDTYAQQGGPGWQGNNGQRADRRFTMSRNTVGLRQINLRSLEGLAPKNLIGIPWRVAFALQTDGWYLRQDIIWSKPNPMPESVRDRCTKAHEYLFLLSKNERYYFDSAAIQEPIESNKGDANGFRGGAYCNSATCNNHEGGKRTRSGNKERKPASARGVPVDANGATAGAVAGSVPWAGFTRNKRSVWTVAAQPFKGAHFATFPPALIAPCILAGCPPGGVVLDPFGGAGTTGLVADRFQRNAILIELNEKYVAMAERRLRSDAGLFASVSRWRTHVLSE